MRIDSEKDGKPCLAKKGDERLTPVGKFLREHHLDELPQLSMQKMLIRLQMDLEYLQQRSLFLDVKIVLTTIVFILKGKKF